MLPPKTIQTLALKVARHEAGHYVIARSYGFVTEEIRIKIIGLPDDHEAYSTIELCRPLPSLETLEDYLRKRIVILYAGALAQALNHDRTINNDAAIECVKNGGGRIDYARATELIQLLRNILHPMTIDRKELQAQLSQLDETFWNQAHECVIREAASIFAVGTAMATKVVAQNIFYGLVTSEIDALPEIQSRFALPQASPAEDSSEKRFNL